MTASNPASNGTHGSRSSFWMVTATLMLFVSPRTVRADTNIPVEQAIAAMEATEERVRSYVWHFHFSRHLLSNRNDPASIKETLPDYIDGTFFYDVRTGRYLVEFERVSKWGGGVTPYIAWREGWSFDGNVYRRWQRHKHGTELPPTESETAIAKGTFDPASGPLIGTITPAQEALGEFSAYAIGSGLVYLPPFGCLWVENKRSLWRLSELLRTRSEAGDDLQVKEVDGTWEIEFPDLSINGGLARFFVDPGRGFVLTGAEHRDRNAVYRRHAIKVEPVADELWVPTEITDYNVLSGEADRIVVSDLQVNPDLTEEDFRVRFPIGTQVDDFIEEKFYLVGAGVENEAQAVKDFVKRHGLGLGDESPGPSTAWRVFLVGATIALLAALGYLLWRGRGSGKAAGMLLIGAVLFGARAASGSDLTRGGNWIVGHSPDEEIRISQCGFNVTVLALELCRRQFDASRLSESLRPTNAGILLSDLKSALEAHGLQVRARDKASIQDLAESLKPSQLAIFPVLLQNRIWHYFAAIRDSNGELLVLDPPARVLRLEQVESATRERKGVVLFVSRAAIDPPLADRLAVEPGRIDLGTFKLAESGDGELSARVTLRGVSDRPVMVNSIMKSCGCTMSDWEGGVIRPGAETHMDVTVERTAWGAGSQRRELRLIFPDGSERRIEVVGEGVVDTRDAGLQVRTGSITFDVPTIGVEVPYRAVEPCLIASESSHSVETDSPWLRGTLGRRGEQVQLVAEIDLDERQLRELFAKCRLQGVLRVTDSAAGAVTKVDVSVIRSRVFEARPQTIFVKKSESPAARTAIVPVVDGVDAWRVSSVASEPSGLQLSLLEQSGSARVVECAATAETPLGVHVARCQIETGAPVPETVQFVVHVGE